MWSGATSRSFTPDSSGSFAVQISKNGFTVTSGCYRVGGVGIKHNPQSSGIKWYPNPVKNFLILKISEGDSPFRLKIWDVQGRLVKSYARLKPPTIKIAFPEPKGIYFGEMIFRDRKETFKVVKW